MDIGHTVRCLRENEEVSPLMFWIDLLIALVGALIVASIVMALLLLDSPLRDVPGKPPGEVRGAKIRFFALLLLLLGIVVLGYVA